jgi:serine phosphatase RsbU (regulator of sigma subunit)
MAEDRLQVTDAHGRRVVRLDTPRFTIGRRSASDLQVVSTDVSREHAEITRIDGQFVVHDRGSRYGTYVNGEPVTERALVHGDRIRLGRTDAVELVLLTDTDDTSLLLRDSSAVTDLRQMAALLDGLRALGSGRVVDEVLTLVTDLALDVTGAERGFVMLADAQGRLEFKVARAKGRVTLSGHTFATSQKIPDDVFHSGRTRVVGDLLDGNQAVHQGTIALGIRYVLCAPLRVARQNHAPESPSEHDVIGVLYLDGRERATMLSRTTQNALEAFATEAALAIESARLYSEASEKARLERDLTLAAEIQRALLPNPVHTAPTFDLAAVSVPCRTIGGDFYDYVEVEDGRFAFALGDVAGKGPAAALLAAAVQTLFVAQTAVAPEPAEAMTRLNQRLLRRAIRARFATMFYGLLSSEGSLSYCVAGHEPPVIVGRTGTRSLEPGGLVLGLFAHATYQAGLLQLDPGDLVVVCSDGVTEALNASDEEFGRDRLIACVESSHGLDPETLVERLLQDVRDFTAGEHQTDDLTALVLRYRGLK